MIKVRTRKRKFFVFPVFVLVVNLMLAGCEKDEVSYPVDEISKRVSETVSDTDDTSGETVSSEAGSEVSDSGGKAVPTEEQAVSDSSGPLAAEIQVYVCGAVASPGVYALPEGSRVYEAVELAGGFLESADPKALNQARLLSDGEQITVLTVEEVQDGKTANQGNGGVSGQNGSADDSEGGKVNINTADEDELMTISGIGESRAKAIIAYREENGKFASIEDIMKIDGIKEKMFEKIRDSITV